MFERKSLQGKLSDRLGQGILRGKYHCTVDRLFDWFGIKHMTTEIFVFICKTD